MARSSMNVQGIVVCYARQDAVVTDSPTVAGDGMPADKSRPEDGPRGQRVAGNSVL